MAYLTSVDIDPDICLTCGGSGCAPHGAPGDCPACAGTGLNS